MKYFFFLAISLLLWSSCSKTPTINNNRASMLRKGKWKVTDGTISLRKPNGVDTVVEYTDWVNLLPTCVVGNYLVFDSGSSQGYIFPGSVKCNASDPDSSGFQWSLTNDENTMSLSFNGFNNIFAITDSVLQPYTLTTISESPLVIDSVWKLQFGIANVNQLNFPNMVITNFSQSSFTLNFAVITTYIDTTNHHTGPPTDASPNVLPDTIHYSIVYTNF